MRLYALRDRLLNYYLQPFVAPNDNAVKASLAMTIAQGGDNNAISQAPHHFELWVVAEIDEQDLRLAPIHQLLCDCHALIRPKQAATPTETAAELRSPPTRPNGAGEASLKT